MFEGDAHQWGDRRRVVVRRVVKQPEGGGGHVVALGNYAVKELQIDGLPMGNTGRLQPVKHPHEGRDAVSVFLRTV
jgi:hypothetical protein